jgi:type II secretory pathway predicted ATPase ExeA
MTDKQEQTIFITPELTHRSELILHLLEYSNKLVVVKGDLDSGKTTFFKDLSNQNESNLILRNLTVSAVTNVNDIYEAIIDGGHHDELQEAQYGQRELNEWLTRSQNKQEIPALLIDNIDLLNDESITQLYAIIKASNEVSVLHVCIFCEPSFLIRLKESGIDSEESDTLHIIEMPALSEKQTEQYIRHNFTTGNPAVNLFDEKTIKQVHRISHGLPGRINALCEQYLDDPAKETPAIVKEKKASINVKAFLLKNRLIISVCGLLMLLSIGVATLLHRAEEKEVKQTVKLELPLLQEGNKKADDVVEIEVPKEFEPEPVTIEELSPSVIPEIAKDLNDKSGVSVYNSQGNLVAQEPDIEKEVVEVVEEVAEEAPYDENVVKGAAPIISNTENVETVINSIPKPEPEPVIVTEPEPTMEPKVEKKPEVKSESVVKDINWLKKQDSKKYVLQLIGAYEQETIDVYLKAFKDKEHKIIAFTASNKGKEWHVLVYGLYENRDQAVAAIDTLPTKAKLMAPWPRTVQSIKDLLK